MPKHDSKSKTELWNTAISLIAVVLAGISLLMSYQNHLLTEDTQDRQTIVEIDTYLYEAWELMRGDIEVGQIKSDASPGDFRLAHRPIAKCQKLKPDYAPTWRYLGLYHDYRANKAKALECYQMSVELDPGYVHAHNNLGLVKHEQQDYAAAIKHYEDALRIDPDHVNAHNNLGLVKHAQGDYAAAISHYEEVLRIDPDHAQVLRDLQRAKSMLK